ncbi:MAG: hypothetical protein B6U95_07575 [Thermofilum sp. ex4484_82]|nr:MAG: hypothetical protein B6U95_07575 [Thermofilum sp. ex4484_82]OYT37037.1 MAG: hypothetical protein B6U96_07570 [Archaeoglobales archaeon ex4484_92]
MGVYVTLRIGGRPRDVAENRIKIFFDFVKFADTLKIFDPKKLTIWKRAPSEIFDGVLYLTREVNGKIFAFKREVLAVVREDPTNTIVEFSGVLTLAGEEVSAVATCFNEWRWRVTYGDMYLDVTGGPEEDFTKYLLEENGNLSEERVGKVYDWILSLVNMYNSVRRVEVGPDPLVRETIFDAFIIYRKDWKDLIGDALLVAPSVTRREIREAIPPTPEVLELGKRIAPYRRIFLVNTIGETLFIEWLRTVAPQMVNFKKGSVLIGSKKVGDIRQLFYTICRGLLEIIRGIPPPENLQRKITSKANIIYRKKFYQKMLI